MKASKKLIGAIASLTLATSLTVGTTFAWFTSRSSVNTDEIELGVISATDTLQIAVISSDAEGTSEANFKYNVLSSDLQKAIGKVTFDALTSADGGKTLTGADGEDAETGSYATFDLVFRTNVEGASLILNSDAAVTPTTKTVSSVAVWDGMDKTKYGTEITGDKFTARAAHASRIAFLYGDNSKVWAPFETLGEGVTEDMTSDAPAGFYSNNLASDYNQMMDEDAEEVTAVTYENRVYCAQATGAANENNVIAAFPEKGENEFVEMRLTVKIWIEGTDGDCLDTILSDSFKVKFGFRVEKLKPTE